MDLIFSLLIFFWAIFWHEIGHIVYYWIKLKSFPYVRFTKTNVQVIPKTNLTNAEKSIFLGSGIILGMLSLYPFFFIKSYETSIVMIAYLVASGMDFYNIIKLHLRLKNGS